MTTSTRLRQLFEQRDALAEEASRALAHRHAAHADPLGAALGDLENAIAEADPHRYQRELTAWLEHDAARLQAHLAGQVDTCLDCRQAPTAAKPRPISA